MEQVLQDTTVHQLQTVGVSILHNPLTLHNLTTEQALELAEKLNDVRLSILADVYKHESQLQGVTLRCGRYR